MDKKSRGEMEAQITNAIIKLEKGFLGRGPHEARTFFVDDMIVIRLRGILTPAEIKLSTTPEGIELVKRTRQHLLDGSRPEIEAIVRDVTGVRVISMHTDISTRADERVIVLTIEPEPRST
jgi:uncharacterized protein YbcI